MQKMTRTATKTQTQTQPINVQPQTFFSPPHAPASAVETKIEPIIEVEESINVEKTIQMAEQAMIDIQVILNHHQHTPQWSHFAVPTIIKLISQAILVTAELKLKINNQHLFKETANKLDDLISEFKSLLVCPLTQQMIIEPVIDPNAKSSYRLAFDKHNLQHFYASQKDNPTFCSTDIIDSIETIEEDFTAHPLVKDLCTWLHKYHRDVAQTEASPNEEGALSTQHSSVDFSLYSFHLAIYSNIVLDVEQQHSTWAHDEQHALNQRVIPDTKAHMEEVRIQTEKLNQSANKLLEQKIKDLTDSCEARCKHLETTNLSNEEKLKQIEKLRQELSTQCQTLNLQHTQKIKEINAVKETLKQTQTSHTQTIQEINAVKETLKQTQTSLTSYQNYANSMSYQLSSERSRAESALYEVRFLREQVRYAEAINRDNDREIDNLRHRSDSGCTTM